MAGKSQFSSDMSDLLVPLTGLLLGIGNVWFVDSGNPDAVDSSGAGRSLAQPFNSLAFAVGQTTPTNSDLVIVSPGHTENITVADGILFGTQAVGITVIGIGSETDRPTFTWTTATTADMEIDAANVTLRNLYFDMTGIDTVAAAIDVNAADFKMIGCGILQGDSGGQATTAVDLDVNATRARILNCEFRTNTVGSAQSVEFSGAADGVKVANCLFDGEYSAACIHSGVIHVNCLIADSHLVNRTATGLCIQFTTTATGDLVRCMYHSTITQGTAADPGSCFSFECHHAGIGADFQHSLPPSKDVLTGGASLRDYFAAQALRSHYIIELTRGKSIDFLIDLIFTIGDRSALRAQIVGPSWMASPQPTPSPGTPPATPASPPSPSTHRYGDPPLRSSSGSP